MKRTKTLLTVMIVVVAAAILVVGFFLLWDILDVNGKLDELLETELYSSKKAPRSSAQVTVLLTGRLLSKDEELLFSDYFRYYFAGLGGLTNEDLSDFFTDQNEYELFDELSQRYEIISAGGSFSNLSFSECKIDFSIVKRQEISRSSSVEITGTLSTSIKYAGLSQPVVTIGEKHEFVLDENGKRPKIKQHISYRPAAQAAGMILDTVLAEHGFTRRDMAYTYYGRYIEKALEIMERNAGEIISGGTAEKYPRAEYAYDAQTAALSAVDGFEDDGVFETYEENDANYISRCIFAGGIPMDCQGERLEQWKWYDVQVNSERKKTGCSQSWFDRRAFYEYVKRNEGFGLVSCETAADDGSIGDVVQLMYENYPAAEFMITGMIFDNEGRLSDYLLSNDIYRGVPMKSLGFPDIRVIHIVGYNTANI